MANWDDQGKQYAAFIDAQLKGETDRRESVNSRASTALTGASGLVTVVLAVFAVFVGKDYVLAGFTKFAVGAAVVSLLLAAMLAVLAGYPWFIAAVSPDTLTSFLEQTRWTDTEAFARNITSRANITSLKKLRRGTNVKYALLMAAYAMQVLAVLGLGLATIGVLRSDVPAPPSAPVVSQCCPTTCASQSPVVQPPVTNGRG